MAVKNIKISNKQAAELRVLSKENEITMEVLSEILCSKEKKIAMKNHSDFLSIFSSRLLAARLSR